MDRFFYSELFQKDLLLLFEAEEVHHMKVLRVQEGETIEIVNGKNELAHGKVSLLKRSKAEVKIEKVEKKKPSSKKWALAVGISPMQRMETIVEKATELGVDQVYFFSGRSFAKIKVECIESKAAGKNCYFCHETMQKMGSPQNQLFPFSR